MTSAPIAEVIIGSMDCAETSSFLQLFGFAQISEVSFTKSQSKVLFGVADVSQPARRLAAPLSPRSATLCVVPIIGNSLAQSREFSPQGWAHGPRALDIYTTDLDSAVAEVAAAGFAVSSEGVLAAGPMRMRQVLIQGPSQLPVVLVETTHRRSSVCDLVEAPRFSEPHSVVWVVPEHHEELQRWVGLGWTAGNTIGFTDASIAEELSLSEVPTPITMTMLSDPLVAPIRLELMTFDNHSNLGEPGAVVKGSAAPLTGHLSTGIDSLVLEVDSLPSAVAQWAESCHIGTVVHGLDGLGWVRIETPGGVRVLLRGPVSAVGASTT